MNICIVAGGPPELLPDLEYYQKKADLWVGVDRGVLQLLKYGITPDAAFGDFDSVSAEELTSIQQKMNIHIYPSEKDETDLEIALTWAVNKNPKEIHILGATGGRIDHFMGNVSLLLKDHFLFIHNKPDIYVADKQNQLTVKTPGSYSINFLSDKKYVSFLPAIEEVNGLTLNGFKYPLTNHTVPVGSTLCISNELILETGNFSFTDGILLVVRSSD
jgi:thiamine pyrophosphokinase